LERKYIYGAAGILLAVAVIIVALALLATAPWEKASEIEGSGGDALIDGVPYKEKNLTTVLFIITDGDGNDAEASGIMLLSLDAVNKVYGELIIDTDVQATIPVMTSNGAWTGETREDRLAVAQTYGNGSTSSCLNTKRAVSNLLYGLQVDYYVCLPNTSTFILDLDANSENAALGALYEAILSAEENGTSLKVTATDMTASTARRIVTDMEKCTSSLSFTLSGTAVSEAGDGLMIDTAKLNEIVERLYYERVQTDE
jgi:hypothetical protein